MLIMFSLFVVLSIAVGPVDLFAAKPKGVSASKVLTKKTAKQKKSSKKKSSKKSSKKSKKRAKANYDVIHGTYVEIPVAVVDNLKKNDVKGAIRSLRLEADSPRASYLLRTMERVNDSSKLARTPEVFNVGVSNHNIYLFLKHNDFDSEYFFKNALKYYKLSQKTKSPGKKNEIKLYMAALYASKGDQVNADKLFNSVDSSDFPDDLRKYEAMALYYSAKQDIPNAIANLEEAYKIDPGFIKFWLGISDDFYAIHEDEAFQNLMTKWKISQLNMGQPTKVKKK